MEEHKEGYIKIKKAYILFAGIIAASFIAGWFGYYFIQVPQLSHLANSTGFQQGFNSGFAESIRQTYYYNNLPSNLVVSDQKNGLAITNGTAVNFIWFDATTNKTLGLGLKAHEDLGKTRIQGTLYLMTSPVKWPQQVVQAYNLNQSKYLVLQTSSGQRYLLDSNQ